MRISFFEIRTVRDFIIRHQNAMDDDTAEAIAKMLVLAGRDSTFHKYGAAGQNRHAPENVFGLDKCPDCGKYLRHKCGREMIFPSPGETPLLKLAEVPKHNTRPLRLTHSKQIDWEVVQ